MPPADDPEAADADADDEPEETEEPLSQDLDADPDEEPLSADLEGAPDEPGDEPALADDLAEGAEDEPLSEDLAEGEEGEPLSQDLDVDPDEEPLSADLEGAPDEPGDEPALADDLAEGEETEEPLSEDFAEAAEGEPLAADLAEDLEGEPEGGPDVEVEEGEAVEEAGETIELEEDESVEADEAAEMVGAEAEETAEAEEEEEFDREDWPNIYALKTTINQEKTVSRMVKTKADKAGVPVMAILAPADLRGYILIESTDRDGLERITRTMNHARGLVEGETSLEEVEHFLTPKPAVAGIAEGDIVELTSGPFKGERARVQRIDEGNEEITVELFEAMVPIPVTVRGDHVRVLEKEEESDR